MGKQKNSFGISDRIPYEFSYFSNITNYIDEINKLSKEDFDKFAKCVDTDSIIKLVHTFLPGLASSNLFNIIYELNGNDKKIYDCLIKLFSDETQSVSSKIKIFNDIIDIIDSDEAYSKKKNFANNLEKSENYGDDIIDYNDIEKYNESVKKPIDNNINLKKYDDIVCNICSDKSNKKIVSKTLIKDYGILDAAKIYNEIETENTKNDLNNKNTNDKKEVKEDKKDLKKNKGDGKKNNNNEDNNMENKKNDEQNKESKEIISKNAYIKDTEYFESTNEDGIHELDIEKYIIENAEKINIYPVSTPEKILFWQIDYLSAFVKKITRIMQSYDAQIVTVSENQTKIKDIEDQKKQIINNYNREVEDALKVILNEEVVTNKIKKTDLAAYILQDSFLKELNVNIDLPFYKFLQEKIDITSQKNIPMMIDIFYQPFLAKCLNKYENNMCVIKIVNLIKNKKEYKANMEKCFKFKQLTKKLITASGFVSKSNYDFTSDFMKIINKLTYKLKPIATVLPLKIFDNLSVDQKLKYFKLFDNDQSLAKNILTNCYLYAKTVKENIDRNENQLTIKEIINFLLSISNGKEYKITQDPIDIIKKMEYSVDKYEIEDKKEKEKFEEISKLDKNMVDEEQWLNDDSEESDEEEIEGMEEKNDEQEILLPIEYIKLLRKSRFSNEIIISCDVLAHMLINLCSYNESNNIELFRYYSEMIDNYMIGYNILDSVPLSDYLFNPDDFIFSTKNENEYKAYRTHPYIKRSDKAIKNLFVNDFISEFSNKKNRFIPLMDCKSLMKKMIDDTLVNQILFIFDKYKLTCFTSDATMISFMCILFSSLRVNIENSFKKISLDELNSTNINENYVELIAKYLLSTKQVHLFTISVKPIIFAFVEACKKAKIPYKKLLTKWKKTVIISHKNKNENWYILKAFIDLVNKEASHIIEKNSFSSECIKIISTPKLDSEWEQKGLISMIVDHVEFKASSPSKEFVIKYWQYDEDTYNLLKKDENSLQNTDIYEICDQIEPDGSEEFEVSVPLESFTLGENECEFYSVTQIIDVSSLIKNMQNIIYEVEIDGQRKYKSLLKLGSRQYCSNSPYDSSAMVKMLTPEESAIMVIMNKNEKLIEATDSIFQQKLNFSKNSKLSEIGLNEYIININNIDKDIMKNLRDYNDEQIDIILKYTKEYINCPEINFLEADKKYIEHFCSIKLQNNRSFSKIFMKKIPIKSPFYEFKVNLVTIDTEDANYFENLANIKNIDESEEIEIPLYVSNIATEKFVNGDNVFGKATFEQPKNEDFSVFKIEVSIVFREIYGYIEHTQKQDILFKYNKDKGLFCGKLNITRRSGDRILHIHLLNYYYKRNGSDIYKKAEKGMINFKTCVINFDNKLHFDEDHYIKYKSTISDLGSYYMYKFNFNEELAIGNVIKEYKCSNMPITICLTGFKITEEKKFTTDKNGDFIFKINKKTSISELDIVRKYNYLQLELPFDMKIDKKIEYSKAKQIINLADLDNYRLIMMRNGERISYKHINSFISSINTINTTINVKFNPYSNEDIELPIVLPQYSEMLIGFSLTDQILEPIYKNFNSKFIYTSQIAEKDTLYIDSIKIPKNIILKQINNKIKYNKNKISYKVEIIMPSLCEEIKYLNIVIVIDDVENPKSVIKNICQIDTARHTTLESQTDSIYWSYIQYQKLLSKYQNSLYYDKKFRNLIKMIEDNQDFNPYIKGKLVSSDKEYMIRVEKELSNARSTTIVRPGLVRNPHERSTIILEDIIGNESEDISESCDEEKEGESEMVFQKKVKEMAELKYDQGLRSSKTKAFRCCQYGGGVCRSSEIIYEQNYYATIENYYSPNITYEYKSIDFMESYGTLIIFPVITKLSESFEDKNDSIFISDVVNRTLDYISHKKAKIQNGDESYIFDNNNKVRKQDNICIIDSYRKLINSYYSLAQIQKKNTYEDKIMKFMIYWEESFNSDEKERVNYIIQNDLIMDVSVLLYMALYEKNIYINSIYDYVLINRSIFETSIIGFWLVNFSIYNRNDIKDIIDTEIIEIVEQLTEKFVIKNELCSAIEKILIMQMYSIIHPETELIIDYLRNLRFNHTKDNNVWATIQTNIDLIVKNKYFFNSTILEIEDKNLIEKYKKDSTIKLTCQGKKTKFFTHNLNDNFSLNFNNYYYSLALWLLKIDNNEFEYSRIETEYLFESKMSDFSINDLLLSDITKRGLLCIKKLGKAIKKVELINNDLTMKITSDNLDELNILKSLYSGSISSTKLIYNIKQFSLEPNSDPKLNIIYAYQQNKVMQYLKNWNYIDQGAVITFPKIWDSKKTYIVTNTSYTGKYTLSITNSNPVDKEVTVVSIIDPNSNIYSMAAKRYDKNCKVRRYTIKSYSTLTLAEEFIFYPTVKGSIKIYIPEIYDSMTNNKIDLICFDSVKNNENNYIADLIVQDSIEKNIEMFYKDLEFIRDNLKSSMINTSKEVNLLNKINNDINMNIMNDKVCEKSVNNIMNFFENLNEFLEFDKDSSAFLSKYIKHYNEPAILISTIEDNSVNPNYMLTEVCSQKTYYYSSKYVKALLIYGKNNPLKAINLLPFYYALTKISNRATDNYVLHATVLKHIYEILLTIINAYNLNKQIYPDAVIEFKNYIEYEFVKNCYEYVYSLDASRFYLLKPENILLRKNIIKEKIIENVIKNRFGVAIKLCMENIDFRPIVTERSFKYSSKKFTQSKEITEYMRQLMLYKILVTRYNFTDDVKNIVIIRLSYMYTLLNDYSTAFINIQTLNYNSLTEFQKLIYLYIEMANISDINNDLIINNMNIDWQFIKLCYIPEIYDIMASRLKKYSANSGTSEPHIKLLNEVANNEFSEQHNSDAVIFLNSIYRYAIKIIIQYKLIYDNKEKKIIIANTNKHDEIIKKLVQTSHENNLTIDNLYSRNDIRAIDFFQKMDQVSVKVPTIIIDPIFGDKNDEIGKKVKIINYISYGGKVKLRFMYYNTDLAKILVKSPQETIVKLSEFKRNERICQYITDNCGTFSPEYVEDVELYEEFDVIRNENIWTTPIIDFKAKNQGQIVKIFMPRELSIKPISELIPGALKIISDNENGIVFVTLNGKVCKGAYISVFVVKNNNEVVFWKDGFTDLFGTFNYISVSKQKIDSVQCFNMYAEYNDNIAIKYAIDVPKKIDYSIDDDEYFKDAIEIFRNYTGVKK